MKNLFDSYSLIARLFPTLISTLPIFVLWFFISKLNDWNNLLEFIFSLEFFGEVTIGAALIFLYSQLIRTTSKTTENKLFTSRRGFPSAYLLLYSDSNYSTSYKDEFRRRARSIFGLTLPSMEDEQKNPDEAIRQLRELSKHLVIFIKDGDLVLSHNIWYGFVRNIIGGAVFAIIACLINIIIGTLFIQNVVLWASSLVMLILFAILFALREKVLIQHAEAYGKQLIAEFMEKTNDS